MKETAQHKQVRQLRDVERLKHKDIASKMGISVQRVMQIYKQVRRFSNYPKWTDGLSLRTENCLAVAGIPNPQEALRRIRAGELKPKGNLKNYGHTCHKELCAFLGIAVPQAVATPSAHWSGQRIKEMSDLVSDLWAVRRHGIPERDLWNRLRAAIPDREFDLRGVDENGFSITASALE